MKQSKKYLKTQILLALALGFCHTMTAYALPSQGTLTNIAATIDVADKQMTITGKGKNNIINWATFNIDKGETIKFNDKNNYLNLVHGVDISRIYGTMSGGDIVYLVNPNGILFGQGAKLDNIGSFVASTRNISSINQEAFLNNPADTKTILGADNTVMDNKDYYPEDSIYVPKISVAELQLTNVPASATTVILDGPGGVVLKNAELIDQTTQIITRKNGGEIGLGSADGNVSLTDEQQTKIALVDDADYYAYDDSANVLNGYQTVSNMEEFSAMDTEVRGDIAKNYMLINDIDAKDVLNYKPIGGFGNFEGMGYQISELNISGPFNLGLFAGYYGNINNLDLDIQINQVNVEESMYGTFVGGLTASMDGNISNVNVSGEINVVGDVIFGLEGIGGIVGTGGDFLDNNYSEIRNSSSNVDITLNGKGRIGGIAGNYFGFLFNVYNKGNIKNYGSSDLLRDTVGGIEIGGIVGNLGYCSNYPRTSAILGAYNIGTIEIKDVPGKIDAFAGGIIGDTAPIEYIGSAGKGDTLIGETYNLGYVTEHVEEKSPFSNVGGIIGRGKNFTTIKKLAATGNEIFSHYILKKLNKTEYKEDGTVIDNFDKMTEFGIPLTEEEMAQVFRPEMFGIYDAANIGNGAFSGEPVTDIPSVNPGGDSGTTPAPDVPAIPDTPDVTPGGDGESGTVVPKPDVPSIWPGSESKPDSSTIEALTKVPGEYNNVLTEVTQERINELIENNKKRADYVEPDSSAYENAHKTVTYKSDIEKVQEEFGVLENNFYNAIADSFENANMTKKEQVKNEMTGVIIDDLRSQVKIVSDERDIVLPEVVYEKFLEPIREKLINSAIEKYDSEMSGNFVNQISRVIYNGFGKVKTQTVEVDGIKYTIDYEMTATSQGITSSVGKVTWYENGKKHVARVTLTNLYSESGEKALEKYAKTLSKLNQDVWENAADEFLSLGLNEIGGKTVLEKAKKVKEFSEKFITALNDDAEAEKFAGQMGENTLNLIKEESTGWFGKKAKEALKQIVEDTLPNGKKLVKAAEEYQKVKGKYDDYLNAMYTQSNSDNENQKLSNAYNLAYDNLMNMLSQF